MTTVCFDFGNTRLKYAVFKDRSFDYEGVLPDSEAATIKSLMEEIQPAKDGRNTAGKDHIVIRH